jgi:glycerophosphoryl diester phosphodiesterase
VRVILVAHRAPSTRAACEQWAAAGATFFEADVQVDLAGQIVVSHYLAFGAGGRVQRDNWRLRWHTAAAGDLRLDELAALVPPKCRILLDLKERTADRRARLVAAIIETLPDRSRFVVCGHPAEDVATLREAGFATWHSIGNPRQLSAVLAAAPLPDEAISIRHPLLTHGVLERLHDRAPQVIAWTVNSSARARHLHRLGVDGLTTDRIGLIRAAQNFK